MGITLRRAALTAVAGVSALAVGAAPAFAANAPFVAKQEASKPTILGGETYRIAGLNRYEVSVNAAKQAIADNKASVETLVLASGELWPDAITATPLATANNAPVLLTPPNALSGSATKFIKDNAKSINRVIISGGTSTITEKVVAQLKSIIDSDDHKVQIERNGGANRYVVAYNNAAETAAKYNNDTTITVAHDALQTLVESEQAYQAALAGYNDAAAAYDAAQKKQKAADAALSALQAERNEIAKGIDTSAKTNEELDQLTTEADEAYDTKITEQRTLDSLTEAASVIFNLVSAYPQQGETTGILSSTLADYEKLLTGDDLKALQDAEKTLGLENTSTVDAAIKSAKDQVKEQQDKVTEADKKLAEVSKDLVDEANAADVNDEVKAKLAEVQGKIDDAQDVKEEADAALTEATKEFDEAKTELTNAITNRPKPGDIEKATAALDKARDEAVKKYNTPAFLATGSVYTDALATGPAAANTQSVILLTAGPIMGNWAQKYVTNSKAQLVSVGGEAIKAAGDNVNFKVPGRDRYEVSVRLAEKYFKGKVYPSVVSGEIASDAISGGSFSALYHNPLVLTRNDVLPAVVENYLRTYEGDNEPDQAVVLGGEGTVTASTLSAVNRAVSNK